MWKQIPIYCALASDTVLLAYDFSLMIILGIALVCLYTVVSESVQGNKSYGDGLRKLALLYANIWCIDLDKSTYASW